MSISTQQAKDELLQFKEHQQKIQRFLSDLEKGDFGLAHLIEFGYILYGFTRAGKTSMGHLLSGNALKAFKLNGQDVVIPLTTKNKKCVIGTSTNSETTVPNFFQVKIPEDRRPKGSKPGDKSFVIDTPGYGDTQGVLRILSNGYYHYRLYSKVQNMKFILCFDQISLKNTAKDFINTIIEFTSSFKNYQQIKRQIWTSCVFLITKVEESTTLEDIKKRLQVIVKDHRTQLLPEEEQAIKDFIKQIIADERIFLIKKYKKGQSASTPDLLQKIDQKTLWWRREINQNKPKQVDMKPIMFSLAKPIIVETTSKERSKQQYIALIDYYNERIKQFVNSVDRKSKTQCSLDHVINQLVKDALGNPDSHEYLSVMKNYIDLYYKMYDPDYCDERKQIQRQLFHLQTLSEPQSQNKKTRGQKIKDKNFIVKKHQALEKIHDLKIEISEKQFEDRDMVWLQQCQKNLYSIIQQFDTVAYKKKYQTEIIYKYGYIIHRIIEETKVFLLLMIQNSNQNETKLQDIFKGKIIDLFRPLFDFMTKFYTYNGKTQLVPSMIQQMYVQQFNPDHESFQKVMINQKLVNFLSKLNSSNDPVISQKIIKLILKYSDQVILENQNKQNVISDEIQRLIEKLTYTRRKCCQFYKLADNEESKGKNLLMIRKITKNIGKLLQIQKKYVLARQVYDSIKFVESVCRLYKLEIAENKSQDKQKVYDLSIQYINYLAEHSRQSEAITVIQETFEIAENQNQIYGLTRLVEIKLNEFREKTNSLKYEMFMSNVQLFTEFDKDFQQTLCPNSDSNKLIP